MASAADTSPNLRVRRSDDRGFSDMGWTDNWMTFSFAEYHDPDWVHFGPLRVMVENHIQPHEGFSKHPHRDVEIVTYVASGTLTHADNFGHTATITAGEMQRISAGSRGMIHAEENHHDTVEHNYQMWLVPDRAGTTFAYDQKKYTPEERQGRFRMYISPDGRGESMAINTDAFIYAGRFAPGDVVTHALGKGRGAWVQMVHGALTVCGTTLEAGDGVGITAADRLEFRVAEDSEVLLFDVRMDVPRLWT
ncbi:pirin family protein [Salisaeta longa]|uniref:pirin family protein n=1 Tax=Salisaeta longa TaxID=503170 RepID=UPI0003B67B9E|nr:pirin family protein [Salisaeta longa]